MSRVLTRHCRGKLYLTFRNSNVNPAGCKCNHSSHTAAERDKEKWTQPEGYDTGIMIYHPLVKQKVPLVLKNKGLAQWYACGPTVYDSTHIGHASSYVRLDVIRRIMSKVFGVDTTLVMGITDVDDKIIQRSQQTGKEIDDITKFYEEEFFSDMSKLNVTSPTIVTRVREHLPQITSFVQTLEQKGVAYKTDDGSVYFDVKRYGKYGKFAIQKDANEDGQTTAKRNSQDFALWKAAKPGEPKWVSPWGPGRPGWHVECSVMASGIFGANFDIHSGGEDLMFPHHENELAQSCAFHDNDQWANYWIHTGHLFLSGQEDKMSKSLKNVISISELLENYSTNHFRMLCLLNNYKKKIEFSDERMQKAVAVVGSINSVIGRCNAYTKGQLDCASIPDAELMERLQATRSAVQKAFADDFNTPQALANVMRLVKYVNTLLESKSASAGSGARSCAPVAAVGNYLQRLMEQLGADVSRARSPEDSGSNLQLHRLVDSVVKSRDTLRTFAKDKQHLLTSAEQVGIPGAEALKLMKPLYKPLWDTCDVVRDDLLSVANVQINDGPGNSTWSVVDSAKKSTKSEEPSKEEKKSTKSEEPSKVDEAAKSKS